jgi:hypothetical protein
MRAALVALALACGGDPAPPPAPPPPPRPARPVSTTTLAVRVTADGEPAGARVLLFDARGAALHMGSLDVFDLRQGAAACRIAPGVVASWDGLIVAPGAGDVPVGVDACQPSPAIPYGRYKVWAWRGVEFERWEGEVDLAAGRGRVELAIALERAWAAPGTLAADLHVHAAASSDSGVPNPQRVIAQAAAGIQVVALSDHNTNGDLDAEIAELGLGSAIASIASNELTAEQLHLGVYPVVVDRTKPHGGAPAEATVIPATPEQLFAIARALPNRPVVQLNHPRFRVSALFDGTGWDGVAWPPPFPLAFDAVEVLAGYTAFNVDGDRRYDEGVRDFYTLIDHGQLVTPVGNSDTHDLNWVLDGTARTYVFVDDPRVAPFDEPAFIAALRRRRTVATTGPWLDVEIAGVGPGGLARARGTAVVDVTLYQARFVRCEQIRITVGTALGPRLVQTIDVPAGARRHHWRGAIQLGDRDTWVGVTAEGDTALPLELTGSYQRDRWSRRGVTPYAIASPVLLDVDGNGRWRRGAADLGVPSARGHHSR